MIEVSRGGEIVWDFRNPDIQDGRRKRIYRFQRVPPELAQQLLAASGR